MSNLVGVAPLAYHVVLRPEDQRVIARGAAHRRIASGVVMMQGEARGLVYFGVADTHVHATLCTTREAAGRFAHDVETSLRWRLGLRSRFEPASIRGVLDQWHLKSGLWYTLGQDRRHRVDADRPHDGTSLLDVLGGRVFLIPDGPGETRRVGTGIGARLAAALPRLRGRDLLALIGGPQMLDAPPALDLLAEAAAAAVGAPHLARRGPVEGVALRAAVHAAEDARTSELAAALSITPRAVQRLRTANADLAVVRAVAIQWRLRTHLRDQAMVEARGLLAFR